MNNVKRLSEIEASPLQRCVTGFEELDWIYGYSVFSNRTEWGLPQGKISLWAGQCGVGKSRLCIDVAKNIAKSHVGAKVLYFQTESPLSDFASWTTDTASYPNIFL